MLDERTALADPLSYSLSSIPWSASQAGVVAGRGAWGVRVPHAQASFYAIRRGEAWLTTDRIQVRLRPGDIVLLPRGDGHCISSSSAATATSNSWGQLDASAERIDDAIGNETTLIIYGHSTGYGSTETPLHAQLSSLIQMNVQQYPELHGLESLFALIESDQRAGRPGWQAIAKRLVDVMFYQSLRTFVTFHQSPSTNDANGSNGTLVTDPAIGLVVGLLHSQPGDTWTVASLARWVNMSRSAFSERFREVVGRPPLQYLTQLRMARASQMLTTTSLDVKRIAALVGYESPSSFTNAFKRWKGTSPADFRASSNGANGSDQAPHRNGNGQGRAKGTLAAG